MSQSQPALNRQQILGFSTDPTEGLRTKAAGPAGSLPLTEQMLLNWASGDDELWPTILRLASRRARLAGVDPKLIPG